MDLSKTSTIYGDSESALLLERGPRKTNQQETIQGTCLGSTKCRLLIVALFLIALIAAIAVGITLGVLLANNDSKTSYVRTFSKAAVATDSEACSKVGADILRKGGSAVDAAVASSFCVGVVNLHSTGIGGGGFLIYYNATNKSSIMIDFRETAPNNITDETMEIYRNDNTSTVNGGMAVLVPGQIKGLYEAWERYGQLSWTELLKPSIDLAREGFTVTSNIAGAIRSVQTILEDDRFVELRKLLMPNNNLLKEGQVLKQVELSKTLEMIASEGSDYFYNSNFTEEIVKELQNDGSVLSVEDFKSYEVKIREVVLTDYDGYSIHGTALPGGGAVMALIFNILDGYNITADSFRNDPTLAYHRVIEAFKFSYGQRLNLGDADYNETIQQVFEYMLDPSTAEYMRSLITDNTHNISYYINNTMYNPPSHGTSHLSVYAENGDTVVTTHSINTYFGSKLSSSTGVIFNNVMDDFSVPGRNNSFDYPPSSANFIRPNHRPLSSMSPTIITKDDRVVMAAGASGGSIIPTATAQIILDVLNFGDDLRKASPYPRLHHQLIPDVLYYEHDFPSSIVHGLQDRNHNLVKSDRAAIVQAIYIDDSGIINAASDYRKGGIPDGY